MHRGRVKELGVKNLAHVSHTLRLIKKQPYEALNRYSGFRGKTRCDQKYDHRVPTILIGKANFLVW